MKHIVIGLCLGLLSFAQGQDDIVFDVEIFRVDRSEGVERLVPTDQARPGEVVEYQVGIRNTGQRIYRPGTVQATIPIGDEVSYVRGSAEASISRVEVEFSVDGGRSYSSIPDRLWNDIDEQVAHPSDYDMIRWRFLDPFEPGQEEMVTYRVSVDGAPPSQGGRVRPSGGAYSPEGFLFDRLGVRQTAGSYAEVVGEVSADRSYDLVIFRATLYGDDGPILGTDTFIVESVGRTPRVFDVLIPDVDAAAVARVGMQVERVH